MAPGPLRFYLTGRLAIEGRRLVDQAELRGPQTRLTLVYLVLHRRRPVPVAELSAAVWGLDPPRSWEPSLRAIVSRLRAALAEADPEARLESESGCYQAKVGGCTVDTELAVNAIDRAEGAWRRGAHDAAWADATVAASIARRDILPGQDLPWLSDLRTDLRATWVRALDVLAGCYLASGQYPLVIALARQLIDAEPYRESGYRHLMRAHLAQGNRGEAIATHAALRRRLSDDLGVDTDPATRQLHLEALRLGDDAESAARTDR